MTKTFLKNSNLFLVLFCILNTLNINLINAQSNNVAKIGDFISVDASAISFNRPDTLTLPSTHTFQKIIKNGETFSDGSIFYYVNDFTAYTPINNSSTKGYLTINNETAEIGGAAVLDIEYVNKAWNIERSVNLDFSNVGGTSKNCSGAVTPWGTVISSEEHDTRPSYRSDNKNAEGYFEFGWQVEIDPASKQVLGKRYAMGNFAHENAAIHPNQRTVYQGADEDDGYLYKFVAHAPGDLSSGNLYVYKAYSVSEAPAGSIKMAGNGRWLRVNNSTPDERNSVRGQAKNLGATQFSGIEDVEIGPDGWIYFAVKGNESAVYYLKDLSPIPINANAFQFVNFKGVYVGSTYAQYPIQSINGTTYLEQWRGGNDNLAFDNEGNLYVLQDGGKGHIWMVENGHTASNPKVKLFAITPNFSEPTGMTFSPDNKFMFLSFQFKVNGNTDSQLDALGESIVFNNDLTMVIARKENLSISEPIVYCNSKGNNVNFEYIKQVEFAGINNDTGANQGYANFGNSNLLGYVSAGSAIPIRLTAGYSGSAFTEYWKVWIDFNQDGDFNDSGENIFTTSGKGAVNGTVNIPSNVTYGQTTMRVSMKWNSYANSCGTFSYGEVEDYTVEIAGNAGGDKITAPLFQQTDTIEFAVHPNPSSDFVYINKEDIIELSSTGKNIQLTLYDVTGKLILNQVYKTDEGIRLDIQALAPQQLYLIHLSAEGNKTKVAQFLKQ